jgi:hypothetical protein
MAGKITLILIVLLVNLTFSSVLSSLAASLSERTWVKLPSNSSLNGLSMDNSLLYYTDSGVWDPVKRQVAWVGGPGTCCANPAIYKRIAYDEATDTWTIATTPFTGSGHGYDANALDPNTGIHFFGWWSNTNIRRWNGYTWGMLPPHPLGSSCCVALSWFPEINNGNGGLVLTASTGKAAWYNGSSWTSIPGATSAPWGGIEHFSEYNPVRKVVWMGSGSYGASGTERVHYIMDAQFNMTKKNNAPFNIKNNEALKTCDPVSGKFLVYNMDAQTWWEYDHLADTWSQITNMNNKPNLGTASLWHVPIPEYNVIFVFKHSGSTRSIYLYRHTASTAVAGSPAVGKGQFKVMAAPNPFDLRMTIKIRSKEAGSKEAKIRIYDATGKLCFSASLLPASREYTWSTSRFAPGIYILKTTINNKTMSTPLFLMR